jgi:hypothetical protein
LKGNGLDQPVRPEVVPLFKMARCDATVRTTERFCVRAKRTCAICVKGFWTPNHYVVLDGFVITAGSSFIVFAASAKRGSARIESKIGALIDIA